MISSCVEISMAGGVVAIVHGPYISVSVRYGAPFLTNGAPRAGY